MLIFLTVNYVFGIVRMSLTGFIATIQYRFSIMGDDEKTDGSGRTSK